MKKERKTEIVSIFVDFSKNLLFVDLRKKTFFGFLSLFIFE